MPRFSLPILRIVVVPLGALLLAVPALSSAQGEPERQSIALVETSVVAGAALRPSIAWLSRNDLLASALAEPAEDDRAARVVQVEAGSGRVSEVLPAGTLLCADAVRGLAGLLVGRTVTLFANGSPGAVPVPGLFMFDPARRRLSPLDPEKAAGALGRINPWLCRPTLPEHRQAAFPGRIKDVFYLAADHGRLVLEDEAGRGGQFVLHRDARRRPTGLRPAELLATPEYLPFMKRYLITPGRTLADAYFRDEQGEAQQESPLILMSEEGQVQRENFRTMLARKGLVADAQVLPFARGWLILSPSPAQAGGGIHTLGNQPGDLPRRVWCKASPGGGTDTCRIESFALSPDGCRLAFFSRLEGTPGATPAGRSRLAILDLCRSNAR